MLLDELTRHIESLLFVSAEPAEVTHLAGALEVSADEIEAALAALEAQCAGRGIRLQRRGTRVQLATVPAASPYVEKFLGLTATTRLSQAALETLAIIAYRQPITRAEIEALRGVDCDGVLRTLMARQLIGELERLDTVGHPIRYGTTFEFMRYFGLQRLEELPPLRPPEPPNEAAAPAEETLASATEVHDQSISQAQSASPDATPASAESEPPGAVQFAPGAGSGKPGTGHMAADDSARPVEDEHASAAREREPDVAAREPLGRGDEATGTGAGGSGRDSAA